MSPSCSKIDDSIAQSACCHSELRSAVDAHNVDNDEPESKAQRLENDSLVQSVKNGHISWENECVCAQPLQTLRRSEQVPVHAAAALVAVRKRLPLAVHRHAATSLARQRCCSACSRWFVKRVSADQGKRISRSCSPSLVTLALLLLRTRLVRLPPLHAQVCR